MPSQKQNRVYPHCDPRVLHAPGECQTCDEYAGDLQEIRKVWGINFTGHHEVQTDNGTSLLPCPAEVARPLEVINAWGRNRASTKESLEAQAKEIAEALKMFREDGKGGD